MRDVVGDQSTVLRVQAIRGLTARPEILAEVVHGSFKTALLTAGANQVISVDDIMAGVVSMSALCPGFSTWFMNIFASNSPVLQMPMLGLRALEVHAHARRAVAAVFPRHRHRPCRACV